MKEKHETENKTGMNDGCAVNTTAYWTAAGLLTRRDRTSTVGGLVHFRGQLIATLVCLGESVVSIRCNPFYKV